jgi:hypothetical protein
LFDNSRHGGDEIDGLQSREEIDLYVERKKARKIRTERREAEAHVRHLNLDLAMRIVLGLLAVGIGIAVIIGAAGEPGVLKLSLVATSAWAAIAAGAIRVLRPKSEKAG